MKIENIEIELSTDQLVKMKAKCEKEGKAGLLEDFLLKPELRHYLNDDLSSLSDDSTCCELKKIGVGKNNLILKPL